MDGKSLAESWWNADVGRIWAEDFEPYETAGKYVDCTNFEGGFSNPTILLIDPSSTLPLTGARRPSAS